ncbi:TPA: nucleotidyltransferase [Candidatus Acetothermia bacterium]|nr:nucleotidyltransferase [Candidatus Acetothermia bacterium]
MKSRDDLVRDWLEKARRDLIISERELGMGSPFTDIICFHSQQACEKGLKAFLTAHGRPLPRTHVLEDLALLAAQVAPEARAFVQELAQLTPYAVAARYPELPNPSWRKPRRRSPSPSACSAGSRKRWRGS